jgi:hypothetical protein
MNIFPSLSPRGIRISLGLIALWIAAISGFVLFNRYREGSDFDSLTDIVLLAFGLPAVILCLVSAFYLLGKKVMIAFVTIAMISCAVALCFYLYGIRLESIAREKRIEQSRKDWADMEERHRKKCEGEKGQPSKNGIDPYQFCIISEDSVTDWRSRFDEIDAQIQEDIESRRMESR